MKCSGEDKYTDIGLPNCLGNVRVQAYIFFYHFFLLKNLVCPGPSAISCQYSLYLFISILFLTFTLTQTQSVVLRVHYPHDVEYVNKILGHRAMQTNSLGLCPQGNIK